MPTSLNTKDIHTLSDFMTVIEAMMSDKSPLWFRGCGNANYSLQPSLYRHPKTKEINELLSLETTLMNRFHQRSIPFNTRELKTEWEYLFFMQHFGIPTRLLDWTESPYIALFFALTSAPCDFSTMTYAHPACVWILKPEEWNRKTFEHTSFKGGILSLGDNYLKAYAPTFDLNPTVTQNRPIALYGTHNSPRIVAQRGVFTIFGNSTDPLESFYTSHDYPQDCLLKLNIPESSIENLLQSIVAIGITDSVVYPDLMGLSMEMRRQYGFRV